MITEEKLVTLVDTVHPLLKSGSVSTYIPPLAKANIDDLAVSVDFGSGTSHSAGCHVSKFTMQSVVKVFSLLLALHDRGESYVFERVGRDQTVGAFNSFETFGRTSGIPVNPFVNSGALTIVDMLRGSAEQKTARVLQLVRDVSENHTIRVNPDVAMSEFEHSDRNRALCYFLRSCGLISSDVDELMWAYCQLCAIEVDVADLAHAGYRLSAERNLIDIEGLPNTRKMRMVRRLMLVTGMYLASGEYACAVGIPAKCGISGATLGIVPDIGGIGIYSPSLDEMSNSVGGIRLMGLLSEALGVK